MKNRKNPIKEAIERMIRDHGSIEAAGKNLFETGVLPKELIVTKDYTCLGNNFAEVFEFDGRNGIGDYFSSRHPEAEFISELGWQNVSKQEVIDLISQGALYFNNETGEILNGVRKFKRISENDNNPVYSDGINSIKINNAGTREMNLVLAVLIASYSEKPKIKSLILDLVNQAGQKRTYEKAYNQAMSAALKEMKEQAIEGTPFDPTNIKTITDSYVGVSKLVNRKDLRNTVELLEEIATIYDIKRKTEDDEFNLLYNSYAIILKVASKLKDVEREMDTTILEINETDEEFTRKSAYEKVYPRKKGMSIKEYNLKINELHKKIEEAGFIKQEQYIQKTKDENGNWVEGDTKTRIVANTKNPWVFITRYATGGTPKNPTFKLSKIGLALWTELYTHAVYCMENNISGNEYDGFKKLNREDFESKFVRDNRVSI